jgi:hypothetical protein
MFQGMLLMIGLKILMFHIVLYVEKLKIKEN